MKTINVGEVAVFDHVEPSKEQALKPLEEAAEVFGAWQRWNETKSLADATLLFEEIADTVQACVNLASALGAENLSYAMENCKDRNIMRGRITKENPEALDADGVPIKINDKLYFVGGEDTPLKCVGFHPDGDVIFMDWEETGTMAYENATAFTHKKPDSWEQLEEDVMLTPYYYCDRRDIKAEIGFASESKAKDVVRRAKALAGGDDELERKHEEKYEEEVKNE